METANVTTNPDTTDTLSMSDLASLAKPKCKKCHGRGYVGRDVVKDSLVMCGCFYRGMKEAYKIVKQEEDCGARTAEVCD